MANPPMSDDQKKKLAADCFKRGNEALLKRNWDYACEMFRQCVNLVPENPLFHQSLQRATEKKYNENGTGASMAGMRLMGIKASIKKSRMQKDWNAMIQLAEDGLAINPWDPSLNADLGEALNMVGIPEAAAWSLERAVKAAPGNKSYWSLLAAIYEQLGQHESVQRCFQRVSELDLQDETRPWGATLAERSRALPPEILSGKPVVEREHSAPDISDFDLEKLRVAFQRAKNLAFLNPDDQATVKNYAELKQQLLQREIEVYNVQILLSPDDLTAKFNLGMCYLQAKTYHLAIPMLHAAAASPQHKCLSLVNLGKCFIAARQYTLALRQFELAALEVEPDADETRMEIDYFIERLRNNPEGDGPEFGCGAPVLA